MKCFISAISAFFGAVVAASSSSAVQQRSCPTVTSTTSICSTCMVPMCMAYSTVTPGCGCPQAVPTVFTAIECGGDCPGGCGGTEVVFATETPNCESEDDVDGSDEGQENGPTAAGADGDTGTEDASPGGYSGIMGKATEGLLMIWGMLAVL